MLQLWDKSKAGDPHEEAFLARYEQVRKWAHHFAADLPSQGDDLVQDAFIQFMAIKPDLAQLRSLDAFLFTIVRNLHRSMLHRHLRLRQVPLSILDFDCVENGLKWIERAHLERVFDDLVAICDFACRRKEVAKSGSLLILRFFHGYTTRETAALMTVSRGAVDERLRQARREAREYLLERQAKFTGRLVELPSDSHEPSASAFHVIPDEDVLEFLRARIFASRQRDCVSRWRMKAVYAGSSTSGVDYRLLAHVVACPGCLKTASACLKLELNEEWKPGGGTPRGGRGGGVPVNRESASGSRRSRELRRQFERTMDHRPQELRVTVNGLPLASQAVVAGCGDLSVSVPLAERIEFVEVLSEQEVRLLMLPVEAPPPEGPCEQMGRLDFGDGRRLTIELTFDEPWPTVHVHYAELETALAPVTLAEPAFLGRYGLDSLTFDGTLRALLGWIRPPGRWAPGIAILVIVALLFWGQRETTASAAELLNRSNEWQQTVTRPSMVLHRTFDLISKPKHSGQASRQRVETWRRPGSSVRLSRLFDSSGALLASVRLDRLPASLTPENAWQFEPAAESYRALAGDLLQTKIKQSRDEIDLESSQVRLGMDRHTFRPWREVIETSEATFEFVETGTEPVRESASPLSLPPKPAVTSKPISRVMKPPPLSPISDVELDGAELAVRTVLHRLNADLGEPIQVHRHEQEIEIAGVVDSAERKQAIQTALSGLTYLRTSLLSPEDLERVPLVTEGTRQALLTPPETAASRPPLLAEWLERQYPHHNDRRAYSARVIELSQQCLGRAFALRDLGGRALFQSIFQDHVEALRKSWGQLNDLMAPAVGSPPSTDPSNADQQPEGRLFDDLNALNRSVLRLFASGSNAAGDALNLEAELRTYWRLREDAAAQLTSLSQH